LKQHAEALPQRVQLGLVQRRDVRAINDDRAGIGVQLPRDQLQQCGLARTARTHDRGHLATLDR
jgi:hypothetical protein